MNKKELELRKKIVQLALLQHNKIYSYGSKGPDTFDCAGLVWYLYYNTMKINIFKDGYGLSTTSKIMTSYVGKLIKYSEDDKNKDLDIIEDGDILLIHRQSLEATEPTLLNKYPGHCGIYIGDGKFIHSTTVTGKVSISHIDEDNHWNRRLIGIKKIIK